MGLTQALRDVQDWHGLISPEAESTLAEIFGVTPTEVREVHTFYPYFSRTQKGRYRIDVCRNLSCHLAGAQAVCEKLRAAIGEPGRASDDGLFSWEEVECLGACEMAPALSVNDELQGAATPEGALRLLESLRRGEGVPRPLDSAEQGGFDRRRPGPKEPRILTEHFGDARLRSLEGYRAKGGYAALWKARGMEPAALIEEVKRSNLRGLGGAGFPSGMKWSTVPPKKDKPHYLVCNADESEPGCFKDRSLLERNPHNLIEGMLIACRAIQADAAFVFIRGEYSRQLRILEAALEEARAEGLLQPEIRVVRGVNAYISGLDTALLETMEGKKAWPRQPPPFPTVSGLLGCPTVVNNVETLMMLPAIIGKGAEWFASVGAARSGGTAVYSISGHVNRPGIYEFPMGTPLQDILGAAGGVREGHSLKAVIPGGTSTPVLTAAEAMTAKMDFDSLRAVGSFLGAGGIIVLDETADMVEVLYIIERFLWQESCGQCTPCREGSGWVSRILKRILDGEGTPADIDNILRIGENITGTVICALGDTIGPVARAMIQKFRADFDRRVRHG